MSPEASEAIDRAWESRPAELLAEHAGAEVYSADWRDLRDVVAARGGCDALIVDAPYSARTHGAYENVTRYDASGIGDPDRGRVVTRPINYPAWTPSDVAEFVASWAPIVRGWIASITDHALAPVWIEARERDGRYAFQPIPIVEIGSRVRIMGDGPSSWACYLVVSRPREGVWLEGWRQSRKSRGAALALPGAYVYTGHGDRAVMGGKRTDCMVRIVEDYSHPGDLVVDPCCGAGTTLLAAQQTHRRSIGGDSLREHAELAANRISLPSQQHLFGGW